MHGWKGKILRVDLSSRKITREEISPTIARDYLGGRGLGIYYLLKELDPSCDHPSRANPEPCIRELALRSFLSALDGLRKN